MNRLPRDAAHDYSRTMAKARRDAVTEASGATLTHVGSFSFEPEVLPGNLEGFSGVAQVPIGFAGPLRVNGEHAQGEFYVPLATTEGTLVASYNRGMRLTREAGGILTTVVDDAMQRAPCFVFRRRPGGPRLRPLGRGQLRRRSRPRPKRPPALVGCATSNSTRWARCGFCASTSPPATPLARTW